MLRVGLTGNLGSGKSTIAALLRELGAEVVEADQLGRVLMEPGQPVFAAIVERFGPAVVLADGRLDRPALARLAFEGGRLQELNAIIHPAVIAAQREWMRQVFAANPAAVAVVESALIFEVERDARLRGESETVLSNWHRRFDRVVVVTAPDELKIARYAARVATTPGARPAAAEEARRRLRHQIPDAETAPRADYLLENTGDLEALRAAVRALWARLEEESNKSTKDESLQ